MSSLQLSIPNVSWALALFFAAFVLVLARIREATRVPVTAGEESLQSKSIEGATPLDWTR